MKIGLSRRSFVIGAGAFGILAGRAEGQAAERRPLKVSPIREGGVGEVLKISPLEIRVGATVPFKALHISDTHLNFWDVEDFFGNARMEAYFEERWVRFPQALNSFYASLDHAERNRLLVLHTGDLLDWNTQANRHAMRRNLRGVDLHYAIGNHEYHSSDGKVPALTPGEARTAMEKVVGVGLTVSSRVINGVNFVAFDNAETQVRPETVAGVKAEFAKGLPVVLMCHIPPVFTPRFLENGLAMKRQILRGQGVPEAELAALKPAEPVQFRYDARTAAFYDWLRVQPLLKAILCGHMHVQEQDRFSETADMYVAGGNYEGFGYEIAFV